MPLRLPWAAILAISMAGGVPRPAAATVVRAETLREKTERAPVIVHAVVEYVHARWTMDETRIETLVTVEVLESLRGTRRARERLTFRRGGGKVGDVWQTAPGLVDYTIGDEVILFLEPFGSTFVTIGIGVGTYRVEPQDLGYGVEPTVVHNPDVAGLRFGPDDRPVGKIEAIAAMTPEPLRVFLKRVRSYAAGTDDRPVVLPRKEPVRLKPPLPVLDRRGDPR